MKRFLTLALVLCLLPFRAGAGLLDLKQEVLAEALLDGPCEAPLAEWRALAVSDAQIDRVKARLVAVMVENRGWGCLEAEADRRMAMESIMVLAAGSSALADEGGAVLRRRLGPGWVERLAESGDVAFMVRAAELHLACSDPGHTHPVFGPDGALKAGYEARTAETCAMIEGVEEPDFARAFYWYAVALRQETWPHHAYPAGMTPYLSMFHQAVMPVPATADAEIRAAGLDPARYEANAIRSRMAIAGFLEAYAAGHDAGLIARARADAALFEPEPLDWSAMLE